MNNWYNRINNIQPSNPNTFQNPIQQANYIMQAMRNPVAFVKEQFPDVPDNIINNPNVVLDYLKKTRGNKFIQQMQNIYNMRGGV